VRSLVREEVDRVVRRLGFAREDELSSLRREVGRLEQQVDSLRAELEARSVSADSKQGHAKGGHKSKDKGGHKSKSKDKKDHEDAGGHP
jgi:hypothetical protein